MRIKLFEDFKDGEFMSVPSYFDDNLQAMELGAKRRSELYESPINQIKGDLFYGIKSQIREWLDHVNTNEKTQESYEKYLNYEIYDNESGILAKYSGVKYSNINKSDVEEVKSILWEYINEIVPYDEVDYYYTYGLNEKLTTLIDDFLNEIQEKELWNNK